MVRRIAFALLSLLLLVQVGAAASFTTFGLYHSNEDGPTGTYVRLPGSDGIYRDWLLWGYPMWGGATEAAPVSGWIVTENLFAPPYNVPPNATAVRLHIKAKMAGYTWTNAAMHGALQVKVRAYGSDFDANEVVHATTYKPAGQYGHTPYDLNHIEVDVALGPDGKVEIFRDVSIMGNMQADLVVYLAGYWALPQ